MLVLDIGPLLDLKIRLWRGAFFSGLTIYLEAIVMLVLVTQTIVPASAVLPVPPDRSSAAPRRSLLAVVFAGNDPVLLIDGRRARTPWIGDRWWREYRVALRLRECLGLDDPASIDHLERFLVRRLPILRVSRIAQRGWG